MPRAPREDRVSQLISRIQEVLQHYPVWFAYLFGSLVQETPYPPKDVDLAVYFEPNRKNICFTYVSGSVETFAAPCTETTLTSWY